MSFLTVAFSLFNWIADATIKGSVVILLVAALQLLVGRRIGPRLRHALWLVVLVRLALPTAPSSSWSIFNLLQLPTGVKERVIMTPAPSLPRMESLPAAVQTELWIHSPRGRVTGSVLMGIWMAGMGLLIMRLVLSSLRLHRAVSRVARTTLPVSAMLARIVDQASRRLNIRRKIRVVPCDLVRTPALHGLIHPTLLLPLEVVTSFGESELRHIVLHELWHLRRLDVAVNWILAVVSTVHWFNPFVWFAVSRIKEERELACDELALSCLEEEERSGYGMTILKLLESFRIAAPVPALVGIVNPKHRMKRRLIMIASFKRRNQFSVLFVGALVLVGAVAFTDARGGEHRVMHRMDSGSCLLSMGKLDQKVSIDLNGASLGELLAAVSNKTGVNVTLASDLGSNPAKQARFTLHAENVPAHMLLMESLTPFNLMPKPTDNGVSVVKGEGCMMKHRSEENLTEKDGSGERHMVRVIETGNGPGTAERQKRIVVHADEAKPGMYTDERKIEVRAQAEGSCKLSAEGKLHRDLTLKIDENGTVSEGKLKLDIDAPPPAAE